MQTQGPPQTEPEQTPVEEREKQALGRFTRKGLLVGGLIALLLLLILAAAWYDFIYTPAPRFVPAPSPVPVTPTSVGGGNSVAPTDTATSGSGSTSGMPIMPVATSTAPAVSTAPAAQPTSVTRPTAPAVPTPPARPTPTTPSPLVPTMSASQPTPSP